MPVQLIRKVRDRQPQEVVKVNRAHWAGKHCDLAYVGSLNRDFANNVGGDVSTGRATSRYGLGTGSTLSGITLGAARAVPSATDLTILALVNPIAWSGTENKFLSHGQGGVAGHSFGVGSTGALKFTLYGVNDYIIGSSLYDPEYRVRCLSIVCSSGVCVAYIDGVYHGEVAIGTQNNTSSYAAKVNFADENSLSCMPFCARFTKSFTPAQITTLHANPWQIFEPETIPLFYSTVTAQYARPTSDVSTGTWTASTGSDLFAMLDETSANDTDYIITTGASTCEVALGTLSDPASNSGHIVRYRISADSGGITVRLRQGTTTIATWTHASAPASLTTYAQTLTSGEADSITNYSALKLQFEAT